MCTVTYIPTSSGFYLTSSRDEKNTRPTLFPQKYEIDGQELFFPKDEEKGGTWIGINRNGRASCLLNGAFKNHEKADKYSKSRGLILIESLLSPDSIDFIENAELINVEPFTLLLFSFPNTRMLNAYELRWDGKMRYSKILDLNSPQIWSSATLYDEIIIKKREILFENWIDEHVEFEDKRIFEFHSQKHDLNITEDIRMKRNNELMTLSISQVCATTQGVQFNYFDLIKNESVSTKIIQPAR